MNNYKISDSTRTKEEESSELSLRPQTIDEYIGQETLKNNLKIYLKAAKVRNEVLDHALFFGPPGLGKTTLAHIIASEMNAKLILVNGPSIEKTGDLAAVLSSLQPGDILFIDEIHRIPQIVEEILYKAMEDFILSILINKDNDSKLLNIELPPFTLIGATTRFGDLSLPLRTRFGIVEKLNYYSDNELSDVLKRSAKVFGFSIDQSSSFEIAKRSRGTPRIANRILKRIRDFTTLNNSKHIDIKLTTMTLNALGIDEIGLNEIDVLYMKTLITRFNGGPVGLDTLAATIGEDRANLEEVVEPYLLQIGMIDKTQKGRIARNEAFKHFHYLII